MLLKQKKNVKNSIYYPTIRKPTWKNARKVTGKATLKDLDQGDDSRDALENEYFNTWSINLSDEDIRYTHESGGLIGLIFHDERMPGGIPQKNIQHAKECGDAVCDEYVRLWMSNVLHVVKTCTILFLILMWKIHETEKKSGLCILDLLQKRSPKKYCTKM